MKNKSFPRGYCTLCDSLNVIPITKIKQSPDVDWIVRLYCNDCNQSADWTDIPDNVLDSFCYELEENARAKKQEEADTQPRIVLTEEQRRLLQKQVEDEQREKAFDEERKPKCFFSDENKKKYYN